MKSRSAWSTPAGSSRASRQSSGIALMFGGGTQLIVGFIELRKGNVFTGTLLASFGAFWLSYFATSSYFVARQQSRP